LYEKDYEILEKSNLENRILFEAVDALKNTKELS
jgi:hypothetical protein